MSRELRKKRLQRLRPRTIRREPDAWYYVKPQSLKLYLQTKCSCGSPSIRLTRRQLQRMLDDIRDSYATNQGRREPTADDELLSLDIEQLIRDVKKCQPVLDEMARVRRQAYPEGL